METLLWTFKPARYEETTYDISLEYTLKGGLGSFISDATIDLKKSDVLAEVGFGSDINMYSDEGCTEASEKFELGQKYYAKIVLQNVVVDASKINVQSMNIHQTKNGKTTTTNMKEPQYNFMEKQSGRNSVICGAELESSK